ncbi:MAG TPA: SDR family NAD(P)-dependent oxidoreductase [Leptospiraceae bacterium]|nr:SDR family NAD(P)-dependent oxidoreductase [Leptospiraceae bacterium]HRG75747.1 SDR family NAD(P)-dependent oxidoreductase [Leptospiraceae bacterium]
MSLLAMLMPKGKNGFGYSTTAEEVTAGISLDGKTILVTGCNSGLGQEAIRVLAMRGAKIVGTARTKEKAESALKQISGKSHLGLECELANPSSVRSCVAEIKKQKIKLDVIICNAGIMALPKLEKAYGYELQFFTNHIGHFILVNGLLVELTEEGRVVMLSSAAHMNAPKEGIDFDNLAGEKNYSAWSFYGQSKIANLLFAKELARRFSGTKKTAYAVHPGVIKTNLARSMNPFLQVVFGLGEHLFLKTVPQGAATECYVATNPNVISESGNYFADCNTKTPRKDAENSELAKKLWEVSEKIVAKL